MKKKNVRIYEPVFLLYGYRKRLLTGLLFLMINLCCLPAFAQNKMISGMVADVNGEAVIGASVKVLGTTLGTTTDLDGKYSFNAPQSGTLVISYIGYKTQEHPLG
ncbi:MAG: carboxypeptidase-like regulatory domain-containing protein, partial [Tannerella sp.]|nr:carboxypeptidase-like regulatory domain-containing protein [Tannerella sp.]